MNVDRCQIAMKTVNTSILSRLWVEQGKLGKRKTKPNFNSYRQSNELGLWCLALPSTIFQLYHGGQTLR